MTSSLIPIRGQLFSVPQDAIIYKLDNNSNSLYYEYHIKKPTLVTYLEKHDDDFAKVHIEDGIRYVFVQSLFPVRGTDVG